MIAGAIALSKGLSRSTGSCHSLAAIITLTDMSSLFATLMHRTVGMSPMRYSLKEITEMSGFRTLHHFTRVFHLVTSETPAAWRRKNRQGICRDVYIDANFSNVILPVDEGQPK